MHLPKTKETAGLIGKEALAKTKPGVIIVNAARGGLIDEAALADAITSGHVRGAGLDVFSTEPCTDSPLFELPQVVVTPHLGASTEEAQDRAGTDVAASVKLALAGEFVPDAVNVGGGVVGEEVAPWLDLVRKLGLLVGALSAELPVSLSVQVRGELASEDVGVLRLSALRGLFSAVIEDPVTFVNAPALAAERGVEAEYQHRHREPEPPQRRRRARGRTPTVRSVNVAGTLSGPQLVEKIVQINGRNFDLRAEGVNLIINYIDQPGALGKIGTLLGAADVNIQAAQLSRGRRRPGRDDSCCASTAMCPTTCWPRSHRAVGANDAGSGGPVMKLAIIAGDGIGPEVVGEAVKVLDAVLPGVEKTELRPGRAPLPRDAARCCPIRVLDELRAHDAILLGAIGDPSVPSGVLERGLLLQAAVRAGPSHQSAAGPAVSGREQPAGRRPRRSTSSSSAKAPRARTPATAARSASARRTRSPPRSASTPRSACERVVRDAFAPGAAAAQAADPGAQEQRADVRGHAVVAHRAGGRRRSSPTSRWPTSTSTPRPSTWSPTRAGST